MQKVCHFVLGRLIFSKFGLIGGIIIHCSACFVQVLRVSSVNSEA